MIEDYIWAEVDEMLDNCRDKTNELLIERFENGKGDRQAQINKAKDDIDRCNNERQNVLRMVRKGHVSDAEAELQFKTIREEQEYWQEELARLEAIDINSDALWDRFWKQLKEINKWFDYGFYPTPTLEQKKHMLNIMLEEFILNPDSKIELRFRLPVDERQVAESIVTLSHNELT